MSYSSLVYGLGVDVNVPIAGLAGLPTPENIDLRISIGPLPFFLASIPVIDGDEYYTSSELFEDGRPGNKVWLLSGGSYYRIEYADGTVVVIDSKGSNVWASSAHSATVEDTATYLLGPILGFVLCLRGTTCLHASAIAIGGKAIAFAGPSGSGKSTVAAAFACRGHPVITDDVLALVCGQGGLNVQPAYPRVRLWQESVESLFGSQDALPRITPNWDKCFLDLNGSGYRFQSQPLLLGAIYFLEERHESPDFPNIARLGPREGLIALVSNTYATYLLDKRRRVVEFLELGRLATTVPMKRALPAADFGKLDALCDAVEEDVSRGATRVIH